MPKIFITRKIPELAEKMLREKGYEVEVSQKGDALTHDELIFALQAKPYDAVLCLLTDKIDDEVLAAAPSAKIFANYAVGFDNIDVAAAKARNVLVSNTPGGATNAVAEHAMALMLATSRRLVEADKFARAGKYQNWSPMLMLGQELRGKTLGIIGLGRIGSRVAEIAHHGFNMNLIYSDIVRNEAVEEATGIHFHPILETLLRESDFISLHVPLTDQTRHLLNKERLAEMKASAVLVNTSRGPVVDENALVEALKNKTIRGAALDVFEFEPKLADGLAELDNVILTPHIASATDTARSEMSRLAAENILAALDDKVPPNVLQY